MVTDKRVYTMRMSDKNFDKIKYLARLNKRSIAMQIEYLIEQYIDAFERDNGPIKITDDNN